MEYKSLILSFEKVYTYPVVHNNVCNVMMYLDFFNEMNIGKSSLDFPDILLESALHVNSANINNANNNIKDSYMTHQYIYIRRLLT